MISDPDTVPIKAAADLLGIPAAQLARWCADGTITRPHFLGSAYRPATIRFPGETVDALREATRDNTINAPEAT